MWWYVWQCVCVCVFSVGVVVVVVVCGLGGGGDCGDGECVVGGYVGWVVG